MEKNKNILIFGEMEGDRLSPVTAQLMRIGKELSGALKQEMHLLIMGRETEKGSEKGFGYGADRVYIVWNPLLENYVPDAYLQAMEQVVKELKPSVILFSQSDRGLDLAPRLAFRLKVGVTLDCVDLKINSENNLLEQVKPVFGGKAHSHYVCANGYPQIASVRDGVFDPVEYDQSKRGNVEQLDIPLYSDKIRTRFLKKEEVLKKIKQAKYNVERIETFLPRDNIYICVPL